MSQAQEIPWDVRAVIPCSAGVVWFTRSLPGHRQGAMLSSRAEAMAYIAPRAKSAKGYASVRIRGQLAHTGVQLLKAFSAE